MEDAAQILDGDPPEFEKAIRVHALRAQPDEQRIRIGAEHVIKRLEIDRARNHAALDALPESEDAELRARRHDAGGA